MNRYFCILRSFFLVTALLMLLVSAGCKTLPVNPKDSTEPIVSLTVLDSDGNYREKQSVYYDQGPLKIKCWVNDPEGVKSASLSISDAVTHQTCKGVDVQAGNVGFPFRIVGLPSHQQVTVQPDSGKVETPEFIYMTVSGPLMTSQECPPAAGQQLTITCTGTNWSETGHSYVQKEMKMTFK